jgi:hypothetical protein
MLVGRVIGVGLALVATTATAAKAQVGTTTEIIAGRVTGEDSLPIAGALVDVTSLTTGVIRHTQTHADGRFTLLFRDGGPQYRLIVRMIGMVPDTVTLARRGDEDRLIAQVRMSQTPLQLAAIQVTARNTRPGAPAASTAGGSQAVVPQALLVRIPIDNSDLAAIATLSPGVVAVAGSDSTPGSFSVAGQPANQNNVSVDGSSFLFGTLPQNSIRGVQIITNAYDVSRGQFTGGQVATTTLSGGTTFSGTATLNLQQPALQFPASNAPTFGQQYHLGTGSFGVGGPLVADKLYYFISAQHDYRSDPLASLLDASPAALANLGVASDSVTRFLQLAARDGVVARAGAPSTRVANTTVSLARFDWDLSGSSSLMVRGDYRHLGQDATRVSPFSLPATAGQNSSNGGGALTTLTSSLGRFINEARVYLSSNSQQTTGFFASPLGAVTVNSDLGAGQTGVSLLQFGGNPNLPNHVTSRLFEASNELSWLLHESHRIKFGTLVNVTRSSSRGVGNGLGTFIYNSLADLDAGRPALFARTLAAPDRNAGTNNATLYLGDAFRYSPSLQFVYGARLEGTELPNAPARNPAVEAAFGRRTDQWPTEVAVVPRLGFTYLLGNVAGIPSGSIKGGVGRFRGTVPDALVGAVAGTNGLTGSQTTLLCAGAAVPTPDWSAYAQDPATIPTECAAGAPPTLTSAQPSVYLFDHGFGAPESWRASIGATRRFGIRWAIVVDALYALGTNGSYGTDLNLAAPAFALAGEGNRPVFAQPGSIVPATGSVAGATARPHPDFGTVLNLGSGLRSQTGQISISMTGPGFRSGLTSLSYTYLRSRDQSNGFSLGSYLPTTDGDPNRIEWGTSDLERRHQFVATVFSAFPHGLELSLIGRLISGPRYTPMVGGDVNGDGARNDRAFVPTLSTGTIGPDLARLLAATDSRAAACIRSQLGQVAERNSCSTPWVPQLDVQVNWTPRARFLDQRFTFSLVATNTLAGLDQLLHGSNLHGWGQPAVPDRVLMSVTGFDPQTQAFVYTVNQHFGTPYGRTNPYGLPFQLGLRGNIQLGTDPVKAQIKAVTGGANGGAASVTEVRDRVMRNVPYPAQMLLDQADSLRLGLTSPQRTRLKAIAARYKQQIDSIGMAVAKLLVDAGPKPDLGALAPKFTSVNVFVVKTLQQVERDMQAAITPEQWAKVPDRIKFPVGQPPPPKK